MVRATGVGLRYRKTVALDSIDLELRSGTMTGCIGPDGVGKSSLLALIAGARKIQQGSVHVLGGDMADARHRWRVCPRIAYMGGHPEQCRHCHCFCTKAERGLDRTPYRWAQWRGDDGPAGRMTCSHP